MPILEQFGQELSRYTYKVKDRRVAIVGANGFIGRNLSSTLDSIGFSTVRLGSSDSHLIQDKEYWSENSVDSIFWLASKITPSIAESNSELVEKEIVEFSSFLKAAEQGTEQVVFASSGGTVYSGQDCPFTEESPALGINAYGRAKVAMEELAVKSPLQTVNLRIANAYGAGQRIDRGQGVVATWMNSIANADPINVYGSLSVTRDFVHIEDVVSALVKVASAEIAIETINIGSGRATSLNEIISELREISGQELIINERPSRGVDRDSSWLEISKAKEFLQWSPQISLHEGLVMTYESLIHDRKGE
jgi:UDP-glucose 4-epimerase